MRTARHSADATRVVCRSSAWSFKRQTGSPGLANGSGNEVRWGGSVGRLCFRWLTPLLPDSIVTAAFEKDQRELKHQLKQALLS